MLPIEDPTDDAYGGGRPGNDLFGDCLVALDLAYRQDEVVFPGRASSDLGL